MKHLSLFCICAVIITAMGCNPFSSDDDKKLVGKWGLKKMSMGSISMTFSSSTSYQLTEITADTMYTYENDTTSSEWSATDTTEYTSTSSTIIVEGDTADYSISNNTLTIEGSIEGTTMSAEYESYSGPIPPDSWTSAQ